MNVWKMEMNGLKTSIKQRALLASINIRLYTFFSYIHNVFNLSFSFFTFKFSINLASLSLSLSLSLCFRSVSDPHISRVTTTNVGFVLPRHAWRPLIRR